MLKGKSMGISYLFILGLMVSSCGAFGPLVTIGVETVTIPPEALAALAP